MEALIILVILLVALFTLFKLGLFKPVVELTQVATRESSAYNREHKARVGRRYQTLEPDLDVEKINANIAKIDALDFD